MAGVLRAQPAERAAPETRRLFPPRRDQTEGLEIMALQTTWPAEAAELLRLALPERQPATEEPERLRRSPGHRLHTLAAAAAGLQTDLPQALEVQVVAVVVEISRTADPPLLEQQIAAVVAVVVVVAQAGRLLLERTAGLVLS